MRRFLCSVAIIAVIVALPTVSQANHQACTLTAAAPSCSFDAPATVEVNGYVSSSCSAGMRIWVVDATGNQVTKFERASQALPGTGSLIQAVSVTGLNTGADGKAYAEILPGGSLIGVGACVLPNNRVGVVQIGSAAHA